MLNIVEPEDLDELRNDIAAMATAEEVRAVFRLAADNAGAIAALEERVAALEGEEPPPPPPPPSGAYVLPMLPAPDARPFFRLDGPEIETRVQAAGLEGQIADGLKQEKQKKAYILKRLDAEIYQHAVQGDPLPPLAERCVSKVTESRIAIPLYAVYLDQFVAHEIEQGKTIEEIATEQRVHFDWYYALAMEPLARYSRASIAGAHSIIAGLTLLGLHPDARKLLLEGWRLLTCETPMHTYDTGTPEERSAAYGDGSLVELEAYLADGGSPEGNVYAQYWVGALSCFHLWKLATGQDLFPVSPFLSGLPGWLLAMHHNGKQCIPSGNYWLAKSDTVGGATSLLSLCGAATTDENTKNAIARHCEEVPPIKSDYYFFEAGLVYGICGDVRPASNAPVVVPRLKHFGGIGQVFYRSDDSDNVFAFSGQSGYPCYRSANVCNFALVVDQKIVIYGTGNGAFEHDYIPNEEPRWGWWFSGPYVLREDGSWKYNLFAGSKDCNYGSDYPSLPPVDSDRVGRSKLVGETHEMDEFKQHMSRSVNYSDASVRFTIEDSANLGLGDVLHVSWNLPREPIQHGNDWHLFDNDGTHRATLTLPAGAETEVLKDLGMRGEPSFTSTRILPNGWKRGGQFRLDVCVPDGELTSIIRIVE